MRIFPLVQTHLKVLKSKDVQDADGFEVFFALDAVVELADDPVETLRIKCHGHGVSGVHRLPRSRENVTEYDSNNTQFKIGQNRQKTSMFSEKYSVIIYFRQMLITENYLQVTLTKI